jgi:DNA-binding MarR family transcriptional regulator
MAGVVKEEDTEKIRIMLGLLSSVESDGEKSQRRLASELGIALGLVNAYMKRCVLKGQVKIREAPARRYAYYLTPRGFAEKSRLAVEYLSCSLTLFRQAKQDCMAVFAAASGRGLTRFVFVGASDVAEIAAICALDGGVTIVAVVDPNSSLPRFVGAPLVKSFDEIEGDVDAVLITDIKVSGELVEAAVARYGKNQVLAPDLLAAAINGRRGSAS